jgi:hypothetical protein
MQFIVFACCIELVLRAAGHDQWQRPGLMWGNPVSSLWLFPALRDHFAGKA